MAYTVHTDGGARGNPGPAATGVVIEEEGKIVAELGDYLGVATNNVAEYTAIIKALDHLLTITTKGKGEREVVRFFLDSLLVVEQLNGNYKVKDVTLQNLYRKVLTKIEEWGSDITFTHVRREQNKSADFLVNKTLDAI